MRVFICDDNRDYRTLIKLVLTDPFEIVGEAADGLEAIEQAPGADPDVLLLDLNMPKMGGFEALPHLRAQLPGTKILVLTTGQAPKERQQALESGADGFIVKPDRVFALDDEIKAALAA